MDIITATREAFEKGVGITCPHIRQSGVYLLPTNTNESFICIPTTGPDFNGYHMIPRWNPTVKDILADDWELMEIE